MSNQQLGRRQILGKAIRASFIVLGGELIVSSCGQNSKTQKEAPASFEGDPCDDTRAVSEAELTKRKSLGYVKESPLADNECSNCNLYLPPKEGKACGECMLFTGPVQAEGYCTYWAVKV